MASEALEPQVVQVVLPDGDVEARLLSLDNASGTLVLRQVNLDNGGEVQMGGQAVVKLSSIGDASASGKIVYLRAGGPSGPILLELHFDSASVAESWAASLSGKGASPSPSPSRTSSRPTPTSGGGGSARGLGGRASPKGLASPAGKASPKAVPKASSRGQTPTSSPQASKDASGAACRTLAELVKQQEEQVRLLEEITSRKDEQLLKMQERLEDALNMLQVGQETYGKQQNMVKLQQQAVDQLRSQLEGSNSVFAACNNNAAEAAAGFAAAKAARAKAMGSPATSPNGSKCPPGVLAAAQKVNLAAAHAARADAARAAAQASAASNARAQQLAADDDDDDEDVETTLAENAALNSKLQELEAEKGQLEAQLRGEQSSIFAELQELQSMMAELGLNLNDIGGNPQS